MIRPYFQEGKVVKFNYPGKYLVVRPNYTNKNGIDCVDLVNVKELFSDPDHAKIMVFETERMGTVVSLGDNQQAQRLLSEMRKRGKVSYEREKEEGF